MGTKWEQHWQYQPNAATMYVRQGQYRNCLAIKVFKYHRNVFPIPRVWQTYRTQNPVLGGQARADGIGDKQGNHCPCEPDLGWT